MAVCCQISSVRLDFVTVPYETILCDVSTVVGEFKDSEEVLRWLRSHEEVVTWDLTDDNFESRTDSHSPDEGTLDCYDADEGPCNSFIPMWETVAHKFHRGKMYRYKEAAKDVRTLTNFALYKFKEQRGMRVPEPPTAIEHLYEYTKEKILDVMEDNQMLSVIGVGGLILIVAVTLIIKAYRIKQENKEKSS
ncbi:hypothetical protein NECAME_05566 [Necator americanus]|uniref:Uncharacterized protein n=1 Tax=Necator americanus TaxID=51031 RepID=W2SG20_NECAM|nr:hypothetical protein NECAME_05566 [Necator americanus]ETN68483.1 hypothetical protein NECAME_05566 [Necator americanus]